MRFRPVIFSAILAAGAFLSNNLLAEHLVILHTNDTHSLIDPDENGEGGVLQRKAIIDSVRKAGKNVVLVDAGDVVQGTLYFKFFRGDVEYPLMNMMGYDIRLLGNHEFDNGLQELAKHYKGVKGSPLSANYDFSNTPMKGIMQPYVIKKIDGKKIGFIGINIDPSSLITTANYEGMKFLDPIATANDLASMLKKDKGCDLVVAVTHIGAKKENEKPTDYQLAAATHDIDIIIGGHSHTLIDPADSSNGYAASALNADGRPVLIAQAGKSGKYLGLIDIDLDNLAADNSTRFDQRLIHVTDRFPQNQLDKKMIAHIAPYRVKIDSVNRHVIARADRDMNSNSRVGDYVNWSADFAKWYGDLVSDSIRITNPEFPLVDFGMMNTGGIRRDMKKGDVKEGQILDTFPFSNHMVLVRIKGSDFIEAMDVAAGKGGEAISDELRVLTDAHNCVRRVLLNGEEIDPEKYYTFCTIDYLAWGNDDFTPLSRGEIIWRDAPEMSAPMMRYIHYLTNKGLPIDGDPRPRFIRMVDIRL